MLSLSRVGQILKSVLHPKICVGCDTAVIPSQEAILCHTCSAYLPYTDHFSSTPTNPIYTKFYGRFNIDFGAALFYYSSGGVGQSIIRNFKYHNKLFIGPWIARRIHERFQTLSYKPSFDLVTCVPIHRNKFLARGYNQSAIIAQNFAELSSLPFDPDILIKIVETESQTKKSRTQRIENVENSIAIPEHKLPSIVGKHILIFDDTLTTGVTIESCGKILLKNGAAKLSIICAAQATS